MRVCRSWMVKKALLRQGISFRRTFRFLLQESPHLVEYIKEVQVEAGWSTDETLPLLLRMLVKLETIRFYDLDWVDHSEHIKQSLYFVLELPTLSTLEIDEGCFNGMDEV